LPQRVWEVSDRRVVCYIVLKYGVTHRIFPMDVGELAVTECCSSFAHQRAVYAFGNGILLWCVGRRGVEGYAALLHVLFHCFGVVLLSTVSCD